MPHHPDPWLPPTPAPRPLGRGYDGHLVRNLYIVAVVVLAAAAWAPTGYPPMSFAEGLFMMGIGLVLFTPAVFAARSLRASAARGITARDAARWLLAGPVVLVVTYVALMWVSLVNYSRDPEWSLH